MGIEVYSLSDFTTSGGVVASDALDVEIVSDEIITIQLAGVTTSDGYVNIEFQADLTSAMETQLDAIVAAHTGVPLPDPTTQDGVPLTTLAMPVAADGTLQTSKQHLELGREPFQRIDDGSEQMNINGVATGSPIVLWNGSGGGDSGADWTLQNYGTEELYAAKNGTYGLDTGVRAQNDFTRFSYGSNIDVVGEYDSIQFWMKPKAYPPGSKAKFSWEKSDGTNIGSKVKVQNYVSNMDLNAWQLVQIPIEDFNLTEDVGKLVVKYTGVAGQHLHIDDIELIANDGVGPYKFRVSAPTGLIYHVERLAIVLSAPEAGWNSTSFASITDGLGQGLLIRYKKIGSEDSETYWKVNCKNNSELFGQLQVINDVLFENGDRQFTFALEPQLSSVVLIDDDEVIDILIRDDLSSISNMRAFLHFGVEVL